MIEESVFALANQSRIATQVNWQARMVFARVKISHLLGKGDALANRH
jgi:hypothetical protein